jgi:hypothetical protein
MRSVHSERHLIDRINRVRAAELGANDGLISTASLIVGVGCSWQGCDGKAYDVDRITRTLRSAKSGLVVTVELSRKECG